MALRQPLHATLRELPSGAVRFVNWAGNQGVRARRLLRPGSEAEVQRLLESATRERRAVRVVGGGHSWSDAALCRDTLVSLDALDRVVTLDREGGANPAVSWPEPTVTVQAGIRLHALNVALRAAGLGLPVLGSVAEQSVAGAILTGTHGSGVRFGNLASLVVAARVALPSGEVRVCSRERDADLLAALRVSLGLLGIVTEVTLRCEPAFDLEEHRYPVRFERAVACLDELAASADHVKLWWVPYTDQVEVYAMSRTTARHTPHPLSRRLEEAGVLRHAYGVASALSRHLPGLVPPINRVLGGALATRERRVDHAENLFHVPQVPRHRESEVALPMESAGRALTTLRELIERERYPASFLQELRFVAADDAWLSPAHGRATAQLGAYAGQHAGTTAFFADVERRMLALGGRPHWGKEFTLGGAELAPLYPRWAEFARLRAELDPLRTFDGPVLRRLFPAPATS